MDHLKKFLVDQRILDHTGIESIDNAAGKAGRSFLDQLKADESACSTETLRTAYLNSFRKKSLFEILKDLNLVSQDCIEKFDEDYGGIPINLGEILVEKKIITDEDYARAKAIELGLEYIDLANYQVDDALFNSIELTLMRSFSFIPHEKRETEYVLIMANPENVDAIEDLEVHLKLPILPKVASTTGIQKLIDLMVETSLDSKLFFSDLDHVPSLEVVQEKDPEEAAPTAGIAIRQEFKEDAPVMRLVDSVILKAVRKRASDIHFEVYEAQLKVKYRIDGVLFEVLSNVEARQRAQIISRLKVMANMDIAEKRRPQDGRFKLRIDDRDIDFRVSVLPSIFGETVVLRILDKSALGLDIRKVGLVGNDLVMFQRNVTKPYGMVLIAGPTGSGKTTTMYSAIKYVHTPGDKFITIEDPVEYQLPDIVQINVNEKKGLTFSEGLRSIVRQDPNKIMVGEIRDPETAQIAINAALTGHLVLSSIHANNVTDAISRLSNMGIDRYEFVSSFNLILSQRLIRRICGNCKMDDTTITEEQKLLSPDIAEHPNVHFQRGKGCRYCHHTGYQGRSGIFEVLEMSPVIKQMILAKESPLLIRRKGMELGMVPLRQAGWKKIEAGETTFEEMNRVTFEEGSLS